jgi:hypothetical protein
MHNPARIVVDIKRGDKTTEGFPPVYSVRTKSYNYNWEKLFDLETRLAHSNDFTARVVLKSSDNKLIIEEGTYKTKKEALQKQKVFAKEGIILYIEKRKADEIPKVIKK